MKKVSTPGGYAAVWLFALFDMPNNTKNERKEYTKFRKILISSGFSMLQYSVYVIYFQSEDASISTQKLIEARLPSCGQVRLLLVTDKQFGKQKVFFGKNEALPEIPLPQILLF
ncbi:CRISPR-associated endonuclease Cas2 [Pigmentibacter sp. JX0631]|uniref:CRISPR-associated endonuclease Cas2 n=1 Tax=Pigmentibacter sp. JX0631 TaxID=2976982 RepID=UPI002468717B|nr:CRISPR-associated endonuclease Cas2 [Pigmentibacter sp. JX0631]WGL60089.1 CRISPR-associated endonuclease Cas2 [Pigmentibacter sp. JX0631]